MEYLHVVTLPVEQLEHSTDMLRYDEAYQITLQHDVARIECTRFTPARWESFGVRPENTYSYKVNSKDYQDKLHQAVGFTSGLRFFQQWLRRFPSDHSLIQS